jgi:hypothetical protein
MRKTYQAGVSDIERIAEISGSGSSGVLEFTSIPQMYRHLYIIASLKSTLAVDTDTVALTLEAVPTVGAYDSQYIETFTSVSGAAEHLGTPHNIELGYVSDSHASNANVYSAFELWLPEYSRTDQFKTVLSVGIGAIRPVSGYMAQTFTTGLWESTAGVDRLRFTLLQANFTTESRIALYGIRG